jgi:hypothetical protein
MNKLEEYIRENATGLDTALPPEGTDAQFLARWEAAERGKKRRIFSFAFSAVAAALLVLVLLPRKADSFQGVENTPDAVYAHYLALVADAWEVAGADEEAAEMLSSLTEEAVPLRDQLPDELSPQEQADILRDYYGDLLAGVDKVMKTIKR